MDIRVADFGLATFTLNDEPVYQRCGTPGFVAPEVLKGQGYSYKADVFSAGSLFFSLVTGRYLFSGNTPKETLYLNRHCSVKDIG